LEFPVCDSALPAADFDALPVEELDRVLLALFAAEGLVCLLGILLPHMTKWMNGSYCPTL
jgi:hypothetical protein